MFSLSLFFVSLSLPIFPDRRWTFLSRCLLSRRFNFFLPPHLHTHKKKRNKENRKEKKKKKPHLSTGFVFRKKRKEKFTAHSTHFSLSQSFLNLFLSSSIHLFLYYSRSCVNVLSLFIKRSIHHNLLINLAHIGDKKKVKPMHINRNQVKGR